ncbi:MAG: MFS transporter [Burkholderiaceae bacterium]
MLPLSSNSLIHIADFRSLILIGFVSSCVRWLETLAIGLFAYKATESAFIVAVLSMLRMLPMGLFGALIGAVADRFEGRSTLIGILMASMITTGSLAILSSTGLLQVWHLGIAAFVNGSCWTADNPVRRMMLGDVVGIDRVGSAISFDAGANNVSRILGPILAGTLLFYFDIAGVFWFGVLLYCTSGWIVMHMNKRDEPAHQHRGSLLTPVIEGFVLIKNDPRLIGIFLITVTFNIFGWPYTSMIPVIATDYLQLIPKDVGFLASFEGIGGLTGAFLFANFARPHWYGRIYVIAVAMYFVTMIGFANALWSPLAALFLFCNGLGALGFSVMQATLVYRDSPIEMRARLLGVLSTCIGTGPIGFLYIGFLAETFSPRIAIVALAVQGLIMLVLTRKYWLLVFR